MQIKDSNHLGVIVRDTRKEQQLTQQELAAAAGVGVRFVVDLEKGKSSCQIAKVLQVLQMLGIQVHLSGAVK